MGRNKLPDKIAACNRIRLRTKINRAASRRSYYKFITIPLSIEEGRQLSIYIKIQYDPKTNSAWTSSCLKYCRCNIYPSIHRKLVCGSKAAFDMIEKHRKSCADYYANNKVYKV
jgi:hypothetical protein